MKVIIRDGVPAGPPKRFACKDCGCVFKADSFDYIECFEVSGGYFYISYCPCCRARVREGKADGQTEELLDV